MVLAVRPVKALVNDPIPNGPGVSVVVAVSPPERLELVPQAKPRMVEEALPSAVIDPFRVMVEVETRVGTEVVRVGTVTQEFVVKLPSELYPVPPEFVAYARTW